MLNNIREEEEPPMELVEEDNDEEMPYVGPNISNFQPFLREFRKYIFIYHIT